MADVVFDPPIAMDLGNNPGKVRFKKLSDFHEWLNVDIDFWGQIDSVAGRNIPQNLRVLVQNAINQRNAVKLASNNDVASVIDRNAIENILRAYADGRLIHSDTEIAAHAASLADRNSSNELAYFYIATSMGDVIVRLHNGSIDLIPLFRASSQIETFRSALGKKYSKKLQLLIGRAERNVEAIEQHATTAIDKFKEAEAKLSGTEGIESRIVKLSNDLERRVSEALAPFQARVDTLLKDAESEITKTKAAFGAVNSATQEQFQKKIAELTEYSSDRLDGFVQSAKDRYNFTITEDFWGKKRRRHFWACIGFGIAFAAGVGLAIYYAAELGPDYLALIGLFDEDRKLTYTDFNVPLALFATLPIIGAFWILRQFLKLFLSNYAQHADASERIAMTETFLALESEGKLSQEDRILIMQALFRRGPSSGEGDGGLPPNWFDILLKRLEPKS